MCLWRLTKWKQAPKWEPPALYYTLDKKLKRARKHKEVFFFYPLEDHEVSKAMAWGIRNRVGIEPSYVSGNLVYYKFYGYSFDIK